MKEYTVEELQEVWKKTNEHYYRKPNWEIITEEVNKILKSNDDCKVRKMATIEECVMDAILVELGARRKRETYCDKYDWIDSWDKDRVTKAWKDITGGKLETEYSAWDLYANILKAERIEYENIDGFFFDGHFMGAEIGMDYTLPKDIMIYAEDGEIIIEGNGWKKVAKKLDTWLVHQNICEDGLYYNGFPEVNKI